MSRPRAVLLVVAATLSCSDDSPEFNGPFDALDQRQVITDASLSGGVHIARDRFGIPHIHASSLEDAFFGQGYIMAHDRLPQMELLRRFGAGTLSELFGAALSEIVDGDIEMRMHRMQPIAAEAFAELQASADPADQQTVRLLNRFADGINTYNAALVAGTFEIDSAISYFFPDKFTPWTPVDSLVLGRFQAFSLSYSAESELRLTNIFDGARATFDVGSMDPDHAARAGLHQDFATPAPIETIATIDGFPNVAADSGSRSNAKSSQPRRPRVPPELLRNAIRTLRPKLGATIEPRDLLRRESGSNAWAVGPTLAGGRAILAGDQHLQLSNPSIFYPNHITVPGELDIEGVAFPGIPGIILGRNAHVSWGSTVVNHDANDVYLETIAPCSAGGGDCVIYQGGEVPIDTWTEEIGVGVFGDIVRTLNVTYERVPHHGPIIPTVFANAIVPRTGNTALSVRYTGYDVTQELRAVAKLWRANSITEAFQALDEFDYGGQNWVMVQSNGSIGWTTELRVPLRPAAAYTFHPVTNPDGLAPFMVLPGDGSAEWMGDLDARYVPHVIDPPGDKIVTANSDPVGATFDGDALNQPVVDGRPLYAGYFYATGMRTARIDALLNAAAAAGDITADDMARIQHDTRSNFGARMRDAIVSAADGVETTGTHPDVDAWFAGLAPTAQARLRAARELLRTWDLETPPAVEGTPTSAEIDSSVATSIFNGWVVHFFDLTFGDEFEAMGLERTDMDSRTATAFGYRLATGAPTAGPVSGTSGQPVVCDDMNTRGVVESCNGIILRALDAALEWAETDAFGDPDMSTWTWGKLHTLRLQPLFPASQLAVPTSRDANPAWQGGYPKAGDNFAVNRADPGFDDLTMAQRGSGPAQRWIAEAGGGTIRVRMALPGGTIFHRDSPHYRDLADGYYIPQAHFDLPWTVEEIVAAGEARWLLHP